MWLAAGIFAIHLQFFAALEVSFSFPEMPMLMPGAPAV
jgi:hypothetical protein